MAVTLSCSIFKTESISLFLAPKLETEQIIDGLFGTSDPKTPYFSSFLDFKIQVNFAYFL